MKWMAMGLVLALAGCAAAPTATAWKDCAAWPTGPVPDTAALLDLAQRGKEAHADCQARYNALRSSLAR